MLSGLTGWHVILIGLLVVISLIVLFIAAAVSIASSRTASGTEKAIWVLVALVFPVLGPILWFAIGRNASKTAGSLPPAG
jgi:hypothetical protein